MENKINAMYFSPTGTTKRIVTGIANNIFKTSNICDIDFTLPKARDKSVSFSKSDIVIMGVPVYAGRVPNILLNYLNTINGNNALAIAIVVYGNRNYDDALIELKDILHTTGFKVVAAGAFIGEHSFSKKLAKNRPDERDMKVIKNFAKKINIKINQNYNIEELFVRGNKPYRKYYKPKDKDGSLVDIRKVKPKTNGNCINCKVCAEVCPMGSIDYQDVSKLNGICIKCGSCIKNCPTNAKYYDDENYLRHKKELEIEFSIRKEPEVFI